MNHIVSAESRSGQSQYEDDHQWWDHEVDVVCTDTALSGLATAISTLDADGEVFLAEAGAVAAPAARPAASPWFLPFEDDETDAYLESLTADIERARLTQVDADLPIRLEGEPVRPRRRPIPTFEGWRLQRWAARCIPSPSGYLYTCVTDWQSSTMDCGDNELFAVTEIGSLPAGCVPTVDTVRAWLTEEASDRGLDAHPVDSVDRLVFDNGVVVGAVFTAQGESLVVRARHGVLVCRAEVVAADPQVSADEAVPDGAGLRVALVGKTASRFGRVELLTDEPARVRMASSTSVGGPAICRS